MTGAQNADYGTPTVTLELDLGQVSLAFRYAAIGDPAYSDVPAQGPWLGTLNDAERYGAKLVAIGNWRSFTTEKRYFDLGQIDGQEVTPTEFRSAVVRADDLRYLLDVATDSVVLDTDEHPIINRLHAAWEAAHIDGSGVL